MATVKEMRVRIGSVKSTQKITKALQMVAAAKLRRAQLAAEAARPYAQGMANVIANLAAGVVVGDAIGQQRPVEFEYLMSDAFGKQGVFPPMYVTSVMAGEKSGALVEVAVAPRSMWRGAVVGFQNFRPLTYESMDVG